MLNVISEGRLRSKAKVQQAPTSAAPRMLKRTGRSWRRTGKIWSSVKSAFTNSTNTCKAPWTESGELDDRRAMRLFSNSGYSSGQSQLAIEDSV